MNEQKTVKFYESVKLGLEEAGFSVDATYRNFIIRDKSGELVAQCLTIDGLNSWLSAYLYLRDKVA